MSIKYLSSSGLTEVWSNIKTYIASKIPSKIVTGLSIKGRTITYTNSDGTTGTLTTQDTNTTYAVATTSKNGLMSSTDKTKLDGIAADANNYIHPNSHPASMITGLTKVATSGSYNDLTNKPTIPTVNNATLTIQKNGTTVKTFTANASVNVTANITVPTKTSELTNNSGFLTSHNPVDSSLNSTSTNAIQNKVVNAALNNKANNSDVVHKSGTETIAGTKTFSSQIKGNISGTSSDVVVGSDTATARGYLVDGNLPWYTWEEGSQLIAGRVPLITDFNNLTKPGVYHVIFCLNDGFVHEEKEYKESLNRPSIPNITTGFRDGILEIKKTSTMHTISSYNRFVQKLTVLSGATTSSYIGLIYQRVFSPYGEWTAWKRVARDEEVVHTTGDETIAGSKTFSEIRTKFYKSLDLYHDEDYKLNKNPSVKAYQYVFFTGKSGWHSAYLENQVGTDGASYCNLLTRNTNEQSATVQLAIDSNGVKTFKPLTNNDISLGTPTNKWKAVYANTFNGKLVGNADTATKATKDASGNVITDTYATKKELGSKANDSNVVHKSGNETIAGSKTYVDGYQIFTGYRFYVKNSKQELGAIPKGTNIWNGMGFYDKNNKATFSIENGHITDGVTKLSFKVTKNADGVVNEPGIFLEASYSTTTDAGKPVVRVHDLNPFNNNAYTLGTSTLKWKAVYANTFNGNLVGNAATATKATQDAAGNVITTTYAKDANVIHKSGNETIAGRKLFTDTPVMSRVIVGTEEIAGAIFGNYTNDKTFYLASGKGWNTGGQLVLWGLDSPEKPGGFQLKAYTASKVSIFSGDPDGTLSWNGANIVRTVNGVGANQAGNVNLTNILGFTPVQQGGGTGQLTNKVYIGWTGSQLKCTVDKTDLGAFVFEGRAQVGTTITAFWGSSSSTGDKWAKVSGLNGTKRVSSTSDTFTPVVGQIYSGNQLYSTAKPNGVIGDTGVQDHAPNAVRARLDLSGAFNSSYKYLCTTAVGVNAKASVDVTGHTVSSSSGPYTTITGYSGFTTTLQGGKSTFLRVQ